MLVHARALLTSGPQGACDYVEPTCATPPAVLAGAARTLDFARPVAVLLLAVLHFLPGADDPAGIVAALARPLAPGSFVVISHLTADFAPGPVAAGVEAYNSLVPRRADARSHTQVSALFGGLPLSTWRSPPPNGGPQPCPSPQTVDLSQARPQTSRSQSTVETRLTPITRQLTSPVHTAERPRTWRRI